MSDHPLTTSDNNPDEPIYSGGWNTPQSRGSWRAPEKVEKPVGWRVPTLPSELEEEPESEGAWHLPSPEDTVFTPEDEIEIEVLDDQVTASAPTPSGQTTAMSSPEDYMALLETLDEEDDFDTFQFSELQALQSLVDEEPKADVVYGAAAPVMPVTPVVEEERTFDEGVLSPAERAALQATEALPQAVDVEQTQLDAADYARQALAALEGGAGPAPAAVESPAGGGDDSDPAAYARRALAELGGSGRTDAGDYTPVGEQTTTLDPALAELAGKFQTTENQVRLLRTQFSSGQITRDDLQAQLRQLMILDNDQVWWMMGVETDTWYKFEGGNWVIATPPQLPQSPRTPAPPTATGAYDPAAVGWSLPQLPSEPVPVQGSTGIDSGTGFDVPVPGDEYQAPRPVDVQDADHTMVGRAAFQEYRSYEAPTLEGTPPVMSDATVMHQPPVDAAVGDAFVEAPYDTTAPPDYDLAQEAPIYDQYAKKQQQSFARLALIGLSILLICGFISGAGAVLAGALWYNGRVQPWQEQIAGLAAYQASFNTVRILDAQSNLIAELTSESGGARNPVSLDSVSPYLIHAVVSLENERFYDDPGWDIIAIGRAFLQNIGSGEIESGASTITQQLARNLILGTTEVSAERKLNELLVAQEIAKQYDKNFILQTYLNEVYFGNQAYGVQEAAEFYFNKDASELNMAESALMAGLIQLPATYDPVVNREESFARLDDVVSQMLDVNCLQFQHGNWPSQGPFCINESIMVNDPVLGTQPLIRLDEQGKVNSGIALLQMAAVQVAEYRPREIAVRYPHFVNLVQSQLEQQFDAAEIFRRGFTIHTTLLPHIQDAAEDALTRGMSRLQNTGVNTGSIVVTDPNTGAVRAMVGSPDFANDEIDGQVNGALTFQQPGSSIKPVVYAAALEGVDRNGDGQLSSDEYLTPASILWDVPTTYPTIPPYTPVNFDRRFHGPISVRSALQNSYNVATVKAFDFIGPAKFTDVASRLGLRFAEGAEVGLASALGANDVLLIDMMKAYGTLANSGQSIPLIVIEQVTEKANDGSERLVTLPERPQAQQVIAPQVAYLMQSILSDDTARAEAFGTNSALTLPGFPTRDWVAVKTGTSNGSRDLWTIGFTRNFVVGVWLGTVDNRETFGASGFTAAAPVWQEVMNAAMARVPGDARGPFRNPGGLVAPEVCGDTGTLADASCVTRKTELVIQSQMPPPADQAFVQTIEVDTWTQLRSNEFCPESTEVKTFANIGDPTAVSWLNNTGEGRAFAQRIGLPIPMENAPVAACELGTVRPTARIIQPFGNQTITGTVPVTGQVTAPDFNRYQLEYASVQAPDNFQIIGDFSTTQQPNAGSVLGQWDTTTVPNGTYIVRLMAFSNSGGWVQHAVQPVNINNAQPTPVPVIQPTPAGISTPLPFDPVGTPTLASQALPVATPTLDPLR